MIGKIISGQLVDPALELVFGIIRFPVFDNSVKNVLYQVFAYILIKGQAEKEIIQLYMIAVKQWLHQCQLVIFNLDHYFFVRIQIHHKVGFSKI